jgi:glycerate 2-kinase
MRDQLIHSFQCALKETYPALLTKAHLPPDPPALIVAVGKAALTMLEAARTAYPGVPFIAVPKDEGKPFSRIAGGKLLPAAHPVPDQRSVQAAEKILEALSEFSSDQRVLMLVSGGGSSLLSAPWGISLEEKQIITQSLLNSGADIQEMNAVRKHVSRIKGGRLATATKARILALYLSDVPGDDLATIASGPTVPDPSTFMDAIHVLDKYGLDFPKVRAHLQRGANGKLPESPKPGDKVFERVENRLIGSNQVLLEAAKHCWEQKGYQAVILSDRFQGEAREMARFHASLVQSIRSHQTPFKAPVVLLSGGEASVTVRGSGKGGRNQEFMAWLCHYLRDGGAWALAADSDGIDGNTHAAGAILEPTTWKKAQMSGVNLKAHLENNDAHGFFAAMEGLLVTGDTANNLNDFRVIVVE